MLASQQTEASCQSHAKHLSLLWCAQAQSAISLARQGSRQLATGAAANASASASSACAVAFAVASGSSADGAVTGGSSVPIALPPPPPASTPCSKHKGLHEQERIRPSHQTIWRYTSIWSGTEGCASCHAARLLQLCSSPAHMHIMSAGHQSRDVTYSQAARLSRQVLPTQSCRADRICVQILGTAAQPLPLHGLRPLRAAPPRPSPSPFPPSETVRPVITAVALMVILFCRACVLTTAVMAALTGPDAGQGLSHHGYRRSAHSLSRSTRTLSMRMAPHAWR